MTQEQLGRPMKISTGISQERVDQFVSSEKFEGMLEKAKHPQSSTGAQREKLNNIRYDYMPAKYVNKAYAAVADFGAKKYAPRNWEQGLPQSQISSSLQRHLWEYMEGEDLDEESQLPHIYHMLWNAVALVHHYELKLQDDRMI